MLPANLQISQAMRTMYSSVKLVEKSIGSHGKINGWWLLLERYANPHIWHQLHVILTVQSPPHMV